MYLLGCLHVPYMRMASSQHQNLCHEHAVACAVCADSVLLWTSAEAFSTLCY